ncbi:eukaryotic translation initiation factor 3 subunit A [Coemansia aciculifera]|uniref:Eukaryotic translation initiation factor 3 subunit A n=1 Tax=Coemansia aciculifera TaxID=417176 RepID=A0ACC1MA40_9FUNG|nr:eukaryotic translation initiation factor 3 subunit A [Coemansia aciculifera]
MRPAYQRPENVLKRTDELIKVGQSASALDFMYDALTSKRLANANAGNTEPVIIKFVELTIEHRRGKQLKEGLTQYRNIVQHKNPESMSKVISVMLATITKHVTAAQQNAERAVGLIGDLEESETPEDMILSSVSGEQTQDRTDRALVTPWLKFLWEAYRNLLDILRNNVRFEALYQQVSNQAIDFCQTYERKTEFRRLCELLRNHLEAIAKYSHQPNSVNLSNGDTMQLFLDTHFHQLNTATAMELWQESYRSIEDIHNLIQKSKRPVKPQAMANYFEKLTRIMYVAKNPLFLAAAWHRYYNYIFRQTKVFSAEQLQEVANNVLLSTLAVPIIKASSSSMGKENKQRTQRFTNLLFLSTAPTRVSLIADLVNSDVLSSVDPALRPLYDLVEEQFHPLSICREISPILSTQIAGSAQDSKYGQLLCNVILTRLVQQLSQVYTAVQLDFIVGLAQFPAPYTMSAAAIERFIMHGARRGEFQLRVDHEARSVEFDTDAFDGAQAGGTNGAQLQASAASLMRTQLSSVAVSLANAQRVACPAYVNEQLARKAEVVANALAAMRSEHRVAVARKLVIDRRKEVVENAVARRELAEARERAIRQQREHEAERQRVAEEQRRRETDRVQRELDAVRRKEALKLAESIREKAGIVVDIDDLDMLDTDKLKVLQREQLEKDKHDMQARLKLLARRADHTERAYRRAELPLLADDYAEQKRADREHHDAARRNVLAATREKHAEDVSLKKRLARVYDDFNVVRQKLDTGRSEAQAVERRRVRELLAQAKEERVAEFRRLLAAKVEAEAEERAKREEAQKAEELASAAKAAKAAELAKLREEMAAQRVKDEELLRLRVEKEREREAGPAKYVPPSRRTGVSASATPPPVPASASATPPPPPAAATAAPSSSKYVPPSRRTRPAQ